VSNLLRVEANDTILAILTENPSLSLPEVLRATLRRKNYVGLDPDVPVLDQIDDSQFLMALEDTRASLRENPMEE
jgi:hypothetical protein